MHVADHPIVLDWLITHGASSFERTILASRGAGNKRQFARDILANNKMAWRFHSLVTCVPGSKPSEFFSVFLKSLGTIARTVTLRRTNCIRDPPKIPRGSGWSRRSP